MRRERRYARPAGRNVAPGRGGGIAFVLDGTPCGIAFVLDGTPGEIAFVLDGTWDFRSPRTRPEPTIRLHA